MPLGKENEILGGKRVIIDIDTENGIVTWELTGEKRSAPVEDLVQAFEILTGISNMVHIWEADK